jgi:hypothetical protein
VLAARATAARLVTRATTARPRIAGVRLVEDLARMRKVKLRGLAKADCLVFASAAFNLIRLPKLSPDTGMTWRRVSLRSFGNDEHL